MRISKRFMTQQRALKLNLAQVLETTIIGNASSGVRKLDQVIAEAVKDYIAASINLMKCCRLVYSLSTKLELTY